MCLLLSCTDYWLPMEGVTWYREGRVVAQSVAVDMRMMTEVASKAHPAKHRDLVHELTFVGVEDLQLIATSCKSEYFATRAVDGSQSTDSSATIKMDFSSAITSLVLAESSKLVRFESLNLDGVGRYKTLLLARDMVAPRDTKYGF